MQTERWGADEVVRRLGGTGELRQILGHSTSYSVKTAVAAGTLRRIGRGTYALPDTPPAYQAAAAARGLVSHGSAARHWLMDSLAPDASAHITVPRWARPRSMRAVTMHFSDVEARDDHGGVTSPLRTVLDCAAILSFPEALSIADSALRKGLITAEELVGGAQARQGPGRRRMVRVAAAADARAANPFESGLRAIVLQCGISGFQPQLEIRTATLIARVDLGDPVRRMVLEADSFAHHASRQGLVRDCVRYDELVRADWLPLRFTWDHVMFQQEWAGALILDACRMREGYLRAGRLL